LRLHPCSRIIAWLEDIVIDVGCQFQEVVGIARAIGQARLVPVFLVDIVGDDRGAQFIREFLGNVQVERFPVEALCGRLSCYRDWIPTGEVGPVVSTAGRDRIGQRRSYPVDLIHVLTILIGRIRVILPLNWIVGVPFS